MAIVFNEDTRVKIPATIQFRRLGYDFQSLKQNIHIDFNTKIFVDRFKASIEKINNRSFSDVEILNLIDQVHSVIKNNDLGMEFYDWLINPLDKVKLIDFNEITNNDFAVVNELPFEVLQGSGKGSFRPDITILVNGIPMAFLEVKKPNNHNGIKAEFNRMINDRMENPDYKKYFNLLQIVAFSNNMEYEDSDVLDDAEDVKAGSFYTTPNGKNISFSFFREDSPLYHIKYPYQFIDENKMEEVIVEGNYPLSTLHTDEFQENLKVDSPCNQFITSLFDKERFLYLLQYGIMYVNEQIPQKHIMRYPQFFATRKIIERLKSGGKNGIIWHTQGSGKTALAAFSNRIIRDYYAKQNINARFYFIVDRLDLLRQASIEFTNRRLHVINCQSKDQFEKELSHQLPTKLQSGEIGEICVVNIHKIKGDMPVAKNDYNIKTQRIFFIDEAHRSYSNTGEFFKNLMTCDWEGVFIALTGTPLLSKKERSNLKFGDYIHKYFYDKSIADGYTLRIKKENIDTVARKQIRENLQLEEKNFNDPLVYESPAYVDSLAGFIEKDFNTFRLENADPTIGGMIVCRSNPQAQKIHEWFCNNSKLTTGLVMSDSENPKQDLINKNNQLDFRKSFVPDILVVHYMLTTGYDVKRLKKLYLLREPHAQSLLQTISRVNRPYKSSTGKVYRYGYIVDFVDIEQEYDRTLDAYIKELEADLNENGEDEGGLNGLVINYQDIDKKYHKLLDDLDDIVSTQNLERFSKQLNYFNKDTLLKIRRILNGIMECETEFILSRALEYAKQIDSKKIKQLRNLTQDKIDFMNIKSDPVKTFDIIDDGKVVKILYEFVKTQVLIMDLGQLTQDNPAFKKFADIVRKVQNEIKKNKNKDDIKIRRLDELLQKIFSNLNIKDVSDLDKITEELSEALKAAKEINDENDRLAVVYDGHFGFVKTYKDGIENYPIDKSELEQVLLIVYESVKDIIDTDVIKVQGRTNFIDSVKTKITKQLVKAKLHSKVKGYYDSLLGDLYVNIQLFG